MNDEPRILLVDDEEDARRILTRILRRKEYETATATTGQEALERARERDFDLAFVDIKLPDMAGVDLIAPLRRIHPYMAVIMVTGYASTETAIQALNKGASAYVTKPLNVDELLAVAREALEKQRLAREKQRAERALRASEERYRTLFERMPVGLYRTTPEGRILHANPALLEILGYPNREALTHVRLDDLYVDPEVRERESALLESEEVVHGFEMRLRRHDGRVIWVRDAVRAIRRPKGSVAYYEGSLEDITEHKQAQEDLRTSEEKYRTILESIEEGYYEVDLAGNFTFFNDALPKLLEYPEDDLIGMNYRQYMDDENAREVYRTFNTVYRTGEPVEATDWEVVRKDGGRRFIEASASLIQDSTVEPAGFRGVVRDVTERKQAEEELHRQERLAAVGRLAGGIAHDFNNLLATIILYAQMPLDRPDVPPNTKGALKTILEESHRAADLVQQILDFSRSSVMETEPVSLVDLVQETVTLLRRTIPENIRLATETGSQPCTIQADATRIHQVLMNLALNARDAMPEGGELRIGVEPLIVAPDGPPLPEMPPGAWARLTVSDTGTGMSEEAQEHLFEPFFTTKEMGKGTGLGLAQVYGIVKQHQGFIDVESAEGEGTTFTILLPLVDGKDEVEVAGQERAQLHGQGETILVVEDAERLRRAVEAGLGSLGYHVLAAANGREALDIAAQHEVDLVLTDVIMPEMGGEALLRNLRAEAPHLKIIAMTGHVVEKDLEGLKAIGFVDALAKPLSIEDLAQAVRDVLDS